MSKQNANFKPHAMLVVRIVERREYKIQGSLLWQTAALEIFLKPCGDVLPRVQIL